MHFHTLKCEQNVKIHLSLNLVIHSLQCGRNTTCPLPQFSHLLWSRDLCLWATMDKAQPWILTSFWTLSLIWSGLSLAEGYSSLGRGSVTTGSLNPIQPAQLCLENKEWLFSWLTQAPLLWTKQFYFKAALNFQCLWVTRATWFA